MGAGVKGFRVQDSGSRVYSFCFGVSGLEIEFHGQFSQLRLRQAPLIPSSKPGGAGGRGAEAEGRVCAAPEQRARAPGGAPRDPPGTTSSHTMCQLNCFRRSTPPQNRQLNVLISHRKQQVDDFVGELAF